MGDELSDYVVLRAAPDLPDGFMPPDLDGKWYDRASMPRAHDDVPTEGAVAVPTGRFEVRDDDGAVAEVWEFRL